MEIIPPLTLLQSYAQGIFPMAPSRDSTHVEWYSARKRGIIPLEEFHCPKNVQRLIRKEVFHIKINNQFRQVVANCAKRASTWINDVIIDSYELLHQSGHAHSVEVYNANEELIGGLYGVHLNGAFFGESMFRFEPDADKVALTYCHRILQKNHFFLWDTQFYTEHLGRFGCVEISADEYSTLLNEAMQKKCSFVL